MKLTFKQTIKFWLQTKIIRFFRFTIRKHYPKTLDNFRATYKPLSFTKNSTSMPPHSKGDITVIITSYRRIENLEKQIHALRTQSTPAKEIWLWSNKSNDDIYDASPLVDRIVVTNSNFSNWAMFALGNLARTEYIAFFDDDILPQHRWFENCLSAINSGNDGILGGSGVILSATDNYTSNHKIGWDGKHLNNTCSVDFATQVWFMRKKHINYIWREDLPTYDKCEGIHLSYMALKYGKIKTFIPPHPVNDQTLWSCHSEFGKIATRSKISRPYTKDYRSVIQRFINDGWQTILQTENVTLTEDQPNKNFNDELLIFTDKLINHENFSIVRFGDGEMLIIKGEPIDLSKSTGGFKYTPNDTNDEKYREILVESLLFQHKNYFVGLPARCCVGDEYCDSLRSLAKQNEQQLTWATIFANNNYPTFLNITVEAISKREVNIICFNKAILDNLPFAIAQDFRIGINAWTDDYDTTLDELDRYIENNQIRNQVFIFCAGVLSNMLIYKLTEKHPDNTYIDVGSVFDIHLCLGKTRRYLKSNEKRLAHACIW